MDTFSVRDLRERTGELIHDAEAGKLSLVTKHGRPVFLAIPFTEDLIEFGLRPVLAVHLYKEGVLTLAKAAKLSGESLESFIARLSNSSYRTNCFGRWSGNISSGFGFKPR